MNESPDPLSPLGKMLESRRTNVLRITGREAARRAGISESRWRQVVKGAKASDRVIVAMALAVGLEPMDALRTASGGGRLVITQDLTDLINDVRATQMGRPDEDRLVEEIERVSQLPISEGAKARIRAAIVDAYEKAAKDAESEQRTA